MFLSNIICLAGVNACLFEAPSSGLLFHVVSLLNPNAIMDTIGVIGTSSLTYSGIDKIAYTIACILVSWFWFFGLSITGRMVGVLDTSGRFVSLLNKLSAMIMWGTPCYLAFSL